MLKFAWWRYRQSANSSRVAKNEESNEKPPFVMTGLGLTRSSYKEDGTKAERLSAASVSIEAGKVYAIIGESGSGKSTLLKALSGYDKANDGEVLLNLRNCYDKDAKRLFAYLPQDDVLHPDLTVRQELRYAAELRCSNDLDKKAREERILKHLKDLNLLSEQCSSLDEDTKKSDSSFLSKKVGQLSGGQRKRVAIAIALLSDPKVLFLDEPTSPLDPGMKAKFVEEVLSAIAKDERAVVFVTHDFSPLTKVHEIIWVHSGKVIYQGSLDNMKLALDTRRDGLFGGSDLDALAQTIYGEDSEVDESILQAAMRSYKPEAEKNFCGLQPGQTLPSSTPVIVSRDVARRLAVPPKKSAAAQFLTCLKRNLKLLAASSSTVVFLLMPFLISMLLAVVRPEGMYKDFVDTKSMLFAFATACFFLGVFNSIQTYSDREMRKVDAFHGLSHLALLASDVVSLSLLCLIQSATACIVFFSFVGLPPYAVFIDARWAVFFVAFLCCESAMLLGLLASALFKKSTAIAPVLVLIQIVFSGLIFALEGAGEKVSYFVTCKWALNSFGTIADLNSLDWKGLSSGGGEESPARWCTVFDGAKGSGTVQNTSVPWV